MGWQQIDAYLTSKGVRIGPPTLGQTTGGTHASGSYHYVGLARDYGASNSDSLGVFNTLAPLATGKNPPIIELYGSDGRGFKNGQPVDGAKYDPASVAPLSRHTHVAIAAGATLSNQGSPSFLDSINPLKTIPDAAGNLINLVPGASAVGGAITDTGSGVVSIAKSLATFTQWMAERGKYLLLAGGGLMMIVMGFVLLTKDLSLPLAKTAAKAAIL